tara:strand:+ start:80 stop:283 length:204 start_codon:yes stop_codon:yes gene_type:complete
MVKEIKLGPIDTVYGKCPTCNRNSLLIAIVTDFYKCTNCGEDIKQYVNGSIRYMKTSNFSKNETVKL